MAATAFARARIDQTLKNEAAAVLADMGLTVSDVVRIALTKIAKEKALPFEMRTSNKVTAQTGVKATGVRACITPTTPQTCLNCAAPNAPA